MPTPPYAHALVQINGGANQSGGIDAVPPTALVQLVPESTVGWTQARWEWVDYPEGWTAPTGWSTDANGVIYANTIGNPPSFNLPGSSLWGKFALRLRVNEQVSNDKRVGDLLDESLILSVESPLNALIDIAAAEDTQFTTPTTRHKRWVRTLQRVLRRIEGLSIGGFVAPAGVVNDVIGLNGSGGLKNLGQMLAGPFTLLGDVTGTTAASVVKKVNNVSISDTDPTAGQQLVAIDATNAAWATVASGGANPGGANGDIQLKNGTALAGLGGANGTVVRRISGAWVADAGAEVPAGSLNDVVGLDGSGGLKSLGPMAGGGGTVDEGLFFDVGQGSLGIIDLGTSPNVKRTLQTSGGGSASLAGFSPPPAGKSRHVTLFVGNEDGVTIVPSGTDGHILGIGEDDRLLPAGARVLFAWDETDSSYSILVDTSVVAAPSAAVEGGGYCFNFNNADLDLSSNPDAAAATALTFLTSTAQSANRAITLPSPTGGTVANAGPFGCKRYLVMNLSPDYSLTLRCAATSAYSVILGPDYSDSVESGEGFGKNCADIMVTPLGVYMLGWSSGASARAKEIEPGGYVLGTLVPGITPGGGGGGGGGGGAVNPLTIAWDGAWTPPYSGSPWAGTHTPTGSTGTTSGGRNAIATISTPSAIGLGSFTVPNFNGTNTDLDPAGVLGDYLTEATGVCCGIIVFQAAAAAADNSTDFFANPCLLGEGAGVWGVSFSSEGVAFFFNAVGGQKRAVVACPTGARKIALFRYDGTNIEISINGGSTWISTAATWSSAAVSANFRQTYIGRGNAANFNGAIGVVLIKKAISTRAQLAAHAASLATSYGVTL